MALTDTPPRLPRMVSLTQKFPAAAPLDIPATIRREFAAQKMAQRIKPGSSVVIGAGSRGIAHIAEIISTLVALIKEAGAHPFIIPAMGSHGGGTPEGQLSILAEYGITEAKMGVPIRASMDVQQIGTTEDGVPVCFSSEALKADAVLVVNRIKPHTDFVGDIGSGIVKMLAIGFAKRVGASACHQAASRLGHERVIRTAGHIALQKVPVLCGVAILENQVHDTARIEIVQPQDFERRDPELLVEARRLMPRLPFDEIDLLIVDQLGKNISGTGMDTNVVNRHCQGYDSSLIGSNRLKPWIKRLYVRGLTEETHGNSVGIGLADFTHSRLVKAMDRHSTYLNSLTALTPQLSKIPVYFDSDREAIVRGLATLGIDDFSTAKIVRIKDTLSLEAMQISEACLKEIAGREELLVKGVPKDMSFDSSGNLSE
ncbi:MAG TPA: lactate racemase domain-containing protein [Planctomycetota bacterium]|nr:lactate racemase domain-containing protein [Planctomycetota bacterium]